MILYSSRYDLRHRKKYSVKETTETCGLKTIPREFQFGKNLSRGKNFILHTHIHYNLYSNITFPRVLVGTDVRFH